MKIVLSVLLGIVLLGAGFLLGLAHSDVPIGSGAGGFELTDEVTQKQHTLHVAGRYTLRYADRAPVFVFPRPAGETLRIPDPQGKLLIVGNDGPVDPENVLSIDELEGAELVLLDERSLFVIPLGGVRGVRYERK